MCHGYRALDRFRDQTQHVKKRAQTVYDKSHRNHVPRIICESLEHHAITFFFDKFFLSELSDLHHLALIPRARCEDSHTTALWNIMVAIGVAGISNMREDMQIMLVSQRIHTAALQQIQALLVDDKQRQPRTILVVLLLALYEVSYYYHPLISNLT